MSFFRLVILVLFVLASALPAAANPQLVVDARSGEVLHAQDAGLPWHPASLTKLMTALVAFDAIREGRVALDTPVIMSAHALGAPPSRLGLPVDSAITLEDALYIVIVRSANDVAVAIAETVSGSEAAFVAEMNRMALSLGMTATRFTNPHGLHDPDQVTSARDLAMLTLAINTWYPQYAPIFATTEVRLGSERMETNNDLLAGFAGTTGMKTGYICASGLNIVVTAERGGRPLIAVVLGASSGRERGEMAAQLLLAGFTGTLRGTGMRVDALPNQTGVPPTNMRPLLCGSEAAEYVAARQAAFPMGLAGQPSYLTDTVSGLTRQATALGRLRDVPLPRQRPAGAPPPRTSIAETTAPPEVVTAPPQSSSNIPMPMPRPSFLYGTN